MKHYHRRSNVETVFSMIKVKLGEFLKCKTYVAQRNELMVKFICHNICCLVMEMFDKDVHIDFRKYIHKLADEKDKGKQKSEEELQNLDSKDFKFENL